MAGKDCYLCNDITVEYAADRLASYAKKHEIKRELETLLETSLSPDVFEAIMKQARERLLQAGETTKEEVRLHAIRFYQSMVADLDMKDMHRVVVMEKLTDLLGVGGKFGVQESVSSVDRVRDALKHFQESMGEDESAQEADEVLE